MRQITGNRDLLHGGDGVRRERGGPKRPSSFSSATAGSVSLFSTFFSLMVKREGKEVIEAFPISSLDEKRVSLTGNATVPYKER